jgi:hypothetical protein
MRESTRGSSAAGVIRVTVGSAAGAGLADATAALAHAMKRARLVQASILRLGYGCRVCCRDLNAYNALVSSPRKKEEKPALTAGSSLHPSPSSRSWRRVRLRHGAGGLAPLTLRRSEKQRMRSSIGRPFQLPFLAWFGVSRLVHGCVCLLRHWLLRMEYSILSVGYANALSYNHTSSSPSVYHQQYANHYSVKPNLCDKKSTRGSSIDSEQSWLP